jgi:hypothetical protein
MQCSYEIDWSEVLSEAPFSTFGLAQSSEIGTCVCDMLFGLCDVNCYCDELCTAEEKRIFTANLTQGPVSFSLPGCNDSSRLRRQTTGNLYYDFFPHLLCVKVDNFPDKIEKYAFTDPNIYTLEQMDTDRAILQTFDRIYQSPYLHNNSTRYVVGDQLHAAKYNPSLVGTTGYYGDGLYEIHNGFFPIPGPVILKLLSS